MKLLILFSLPLLFGFSFSPMSQSIYLDGKMKATQFQLSNESDEDIAIELTTRERRMDINGNEQYPETTEVSVFPPQMIIPKHEKRTIRVVYNGAKDIKAEKPYRVIAEQLPLKVDAKAKKKSGIQMLMKYMAALYVTPEGARPDLKVSSHETKNGVLNLTLENSGTAHRVLIEPELTIEDAGKKTKLDHTQLEGMTGENVLGGSKRTFIIKAVRNVSPAAKFTLKVND